MFEVWQKYNDKEVKLAMAEFLKITRLAGHMSGIQKNDTEANWAVYSYLDTFCLGIMCLEAGKLMAEEERKAHEVTQ